MRRQGYRQRASKLEHPRHLCSCCQRYWTRHSAMRLDANSS
ncbi:MAG: hypothetical protein GY822_25795 [Deltaproteobacteria bacterium]|nr:hypothetical protein [Deltaproteobacteria bacterium]